MAKKKPPIKLNPKIEPDLIKHKLDLCRQKDKRWGRAAYRMGRCISESDVRRFEKQYAIELPDDYRTFITQVGNGGPGPCDRLQGCEATRQDSLKYLSKPFPHSRLWNLPRAYFDNVPDTDDDEKQSWARYEDYLMQYWDPAHIQGALPFCDQGCNHCLLLVLNGPERGTVWTDERAENAGVMPIALNLDAPDQDIPGWWIRDCSKGRKKRVTFATLYNFWLDRNIRRLRISIEALS